MFQCSSASRKFLNAAGSGPHEVALRFQCSSASRKFLNTRSAPPAPQRDRVSVLFSEPKIPQQRRGRRRAEWRILVSVLFSEPKIPQPRSVTPCVRSRWVSVLFSEPKIPQRHSTTVGGDSHVVSVLFSEPKIPQPRPSHLRPSIFPTAMITLRHS